MYTNNAYLNPLETELEDLEHPLRINSCGTYRFDTQSPFHENIRPHGREDYQLIYVASGQAYVRTPQELSSQAKEQEHTVPAGNMILYLPGQPQHYYYRPQDCPEIYWIHFTGYEVPYLLATHGCNPVQAPFIIPCGTLPEYQKLVIQMIQELQVMRPDFQELLVLLFRQLLVFISRHQKEGTIKDKRLQAQIRQAVLYFHENFAAPIVVEEYAQSCHMSTCWFIRSFKQQMGTPPLKYLTSIRLNRARDLLESTEYTITEISRMVGFENPLYFSRIFSKQMGQSPSAYRKHFITDYI